MESWISLLTLKRRSIRTRLILLLFMLVLLLTITACKSIAGSSDERIEQVEKAVMDIRASLYTPDDAELLAEKLYHGSNPELYPGCVSGHIYLAYHSPQSFDEILAEYRTALKKAGWEPSPDYSHNNNDADIFQLGTQSLIDIASFPLREDLLIIPTATDPARQQGTIYYVGLTYYDPSIKDCSE